MSWTYEQISGKLRDPDGNVVGIGYSGAGTGKNNPAMQNVVDVGPIPVGTYTIVGPPIITKEHGPYVLKLVPDENTSLLITSYGRDPATFLLHGDSIPHPGTASEGCVIQDRMTRERVNASLPTDNTLIVVSGLNDNDEVNA